MQKFNCLIDGIAYQMTCEATIFPGVGTQYAGELKTPDPEPYKLWILYTEKPDPRYSSNARPEIKKAIQEFESNPSTPSLYL